MTSDRLRELADLCEERELTPAELVEAFDLAREVAAVPGEPENREEWPEKITVTRWPTTSSVPSVLHDEEDPDSGEIQAIYVSLQTIRERLEKLPRFEPEHDDSDRLRTGFFLGNDPIVMEEQPLDFMEGEWVRRSDVLSAFPPDDKED